MGMLAAAVLAAMPWMLVRMWGAARLSDGPLRSQLEGAARRLRFRYSDILVWNTRGNVANAMVTGLFPVPRFVLLSDGLIQHLKPEEIEAVFGHEVGHIKHHHMGLYLGFLMVSLTAMISTGQRYARRILAGTIVSRQLRMAGIRVSVAAL
jgi:STE24 endopeptidase